MPSAWTISTASGTLAFAVGVAPGPDPEPPASYGGFPLIPNLATITPRITASRLSGEEPLSVQVRAHATTATFSDGGAAFEALANRAFEPYLDLEFSWNFGDPGGAETFTHPVYGVTMDANTDQPGPEAAYLYRTPGTYAITLTVRAWTGSAYVTASTTTLRLDELQQVWVDGTPTGGTYTLSLDTETTGTIAYNADAATIAAALEALPSVGSGGAVATHYGRFFKLGTTARGLLSGDATGLTGGTSPTIRTRRLVAGGTAGAVTCSAWSGTTAYHDSAYDGSNGASDGTIERPYTTFSVASDRRSRLKRGSSWSTAVDVTNRNHYRVEPYGEGADPVVGTTSANALAGEVRRGATNADAVLSGVHFRSDSGYAMFLYISSNGPADAFPSTFRDFLLDGCTFGGPCAHGLHGGSQEGGANWTYWGCDFYRDATTQQDEQGLYPGLAEGLAVVGGTFSGGDGDSVLDHHIYPNVLRHAAYRWIDFLPCDLLNFAVNANCRTDGVNILYTLFDGLNITGTNNGLDAGNTSNNPSLGRFDAYLVQNCAVHVGQVGTQKIGIMGDCHTRVVVRDSRFWGNGSQDISVTDNGHAHLSAYRNLAWRDSASPSIVLGGATIGGYVADNAFGSSLAYAGSTEAVVAIYGVSQAANPWAIDRNAYWTPNAASPFRNASGSGTKLDWSGWKALGVDESGSFGVDPGWSDPAKGDFTTGGG